LTPKGSFSGIGCLQGKLLVGNYTTVLRRNFRNAIRKERPDFSGKKWFLLQDNARPHTAKVAMDALTKIGGTPLEHPPYSPDLAPCHFWAFSAMKREL
jgi:histone-lysine N-methyltransferase SETMAR